MTEPLSKVDSAIEGVDAVDAKDAKSVKKPRQSTVAAAGVFKIEDLGTFELSVYSGNCRTCTDMHPVEEGKTLQIARQTQKTGW